ncbi:hypothetical protein F5J12DRAFT_684549, partial [Pisolithus orientalis]|uniref:uncharacterized protein n=1 Tax=Pisolithus orientalis TaxID=936130 RepID=UPI0022250B75
TCGLSQDALDQLCNPPKEPAIFCNDEVLRSAIKLYVSPNHTDGNYETVQKVFQEVPGFNEFPSLHQIKWITAELSGVEAVIYDMCANSCVEFTVGDI